MARTSRRRGRRRKHDDFDDETPKRTREIVDKRVVGAARQFGATREDFKDGGFSCNKCKWRTKKRGFSGRQALRAHLKRHVRERRSILRPLMVQAVVVLCAVSIYLFADEIPAEVAPVDLDRIPVELSVDSELPAKVAAFAAPSTMLLAHWVVAFRFARSGRPRISRIASSVQMLNDLALLVAAAFASGVVGVAIWPGWLAGFLVLAGSNAYLAAALSRLRLDMKRREFQPSGYSPLFMTGSAEVDEKLSSFRGRIKSAIYRGELNPEKVGARWRKLLASLGMGHVRPRPQPTVGQPRSSKRRGLRRQR